MLSTFPGELPEGHLSTKYHLISSLDLFNDTYGFGPGVGGLAYLGMGVGFFIAMFFAARVADWIYRTVCVMIQ